MVNIVIYIIAGFIVAGLILTIKIMSGNIKGYKKEIAQKDFAIEKAAQNIKVLTDHQRLIKKIRVKHYGFIERIGKVTEDDNEEIDNILRDIVTINNLSVSNRKDNTD